MPNGIKFQIQINICFILHEAHDTFALFDINLLRNKYPKAFRYLKDNTVYFLALKNKALGSVLDLNTANYRVHENGVWSSNTDFQNNLANYHNFSEIRNLVLTNKAIENNTIKTIRLLYFSMIDDKLNSNIPFLHYHQLLPEMLNHLSLKDKLRFFKSYLEKFFERKTK